MILVDTSVWILSFRDARTREADHLRELMDADEVALAAPVRIEILSGARLRDLARLRRLLSALPLWLPDSSTWKRMESWVQLAVGMGERFGIADLLVAAIAADHDVALWSLDADFARMERLDFVALHRVN